MDTKFIILRCFTILILYWNTFVKGDITYGLCANPTCSVPVSKGTTILRYSSPDDSRISVEPNENVEIFVKDYGPKKDLWGVVVRGNKGYISKQFIRETVAHEKNLVPAEVEFKTSLPVISSHTTTVDLHVSSSHQSDQFLHIHTFQQDVISPIPTGVQLQGNHPTENLEASHLSSHLTSSHNSHSTFDVPDHSSQFDDFLSPSYVPALKSGNILPSQSEGLNTELNPNLQEKFQTPIPQNSINNKLNTQPNLFQLPRSEHFQPDSIVPGQGFQSSNLPQSNIPLQNLQPALNSQHQNVPPSRMNHQNFQPSSTTSQKNFQPLSNEYQQNFKHPSRQQDFQPLSDQQNFHSLPSMKQQHFEQPSSVQLQDFHSAPPQQIHSSYSSDYNYDPIYEEEYAKTMALLRKRSSNSMHANSAPTLDLHQSSQDINPEFGSKQAEFVAVPVQSQPLTIPSMDTTFHSSSNLNPTVTQKGHISQSEVSGESYNNILHKEQLEDTKKDTVVIKNTYDGNYEALLKELNAEVGNNAKDEDDAEIDEEEDAEIDDEEGTEIDDEEGTEIDDEEGTEIDEEEEVYTTIVNPGSQETAKSNESISEREEILKSEQPVVESSMTSHSFNEKVLKTPSSLHDSSSISDASIKEQHVMLPEKQTTFSPKKSQSSFELDQRETVNFQETSVPDIKKLQTSILEGKSEETNLNITSSVDNPSVIVIDPTMVNLNPLPTEIIKNRNVETIKDDFLQREIFTDIPDRNNNDALQGENDIFKEISPKINDFLKENEPTSELNEFVNTLDVDGIEDLKNTYQVRNLKGESVTTDEIQSDSDSSKEENITHPDADIYSSFENGWDALKSILDSVMAWFPEPLYSAVMGLQEKGISPRVPVFTAICGFTLVFLIVPLIYIREYSKESKLSAKLASVEKDAYTFSATNALLEEKLENLQAERNTLQSCLEEEKSHSEKLKSEFEKQTEEFENTKAELESCLDEYEALREKENEYLSLFNKHDKEKEDWIEQKNLFEKTIKDHSETIANLMDQLLESERNIEDLEKEKVQYEKLKEDYEEKLSQFERNCNQLLQEAEVWNLRVTELTSKVSEERALKEEIEASCKEKDQEIESLKQLVETFQAFEEIEDPEEQQKCKEEKLQILMDSATISHQLKKQEDETKILAELLEKEKNKLLDMEVELLEAKSEIDKLKISYNQALQDKAEAQTKLDVLTNYFKDKEIQLQKQLGAQEAVRQKKEEDASSAERRIVLIEQENASYKYQVASMKQEMEETERNLKSQIAVQEKKAHENWIAARAAERKLEDMKQEVTQLRQRLTLLEREQENWTNASRDGIIRPVPKRVPGVSDESGNQDMNSSERGMFPPPMLPPPPMMLPPDRPLPPLPPPHMFMPPMERHFRPQPWHLPPPDAGSDFRSTPPEFVAGRESTPPRRRPFDVNDGDVGPHASSPLTTDTRDSRNSTPPHLLPDFHDVPPQSGRLPFYPPPPLGHPRLPMHPPFRREKGPGPKRLDNPNEYNSRGSQQPPPSQEQWQHSRV